MIVFLCYGIIGRREILHNKKILYVAPISRNGTAKKTIHGSHGDLEIEVPRDRNGEFEPKLIKKRQTRINSFDEKIISMYARGMTTRDIQSHIKEIKEFIADLKEIYQSSKESRGESKVLALEEKWGKRYALAVRPWIQNWDNLKTFFKFPEETAILNLGKKSFSS